MERDDASTTRKATAFTAFVIAMALTVVAGFALCSCSGGGVPEDRVRQDVAESGIASHGAVPSSYVDETPYELIEFTMGGQSDEEVHAFGIDTARYVEFSGKVRNESFETSFSGHVRYAMQGDAWERVEDPSIDASSTIPLKGVDCTDAARNAGENETVVSFESSLEDGGGSYTSTARQTSTVDRWFAADTVETEQEFSFDSEAGWKPFGEAKASSVKTDYKLEGRTFACTTYPGLYNNEGKVTYALAFSDIAEDGTATVEYTIDYDPVEGAETWSGTLKSVHESGTATGLLDYSPGDYGFEVELNDPEKGVTFSCASGTATMSAGTGTVDALDVKVDSTIAYASEEGSFLGEFETRTFAEVL